MVAGKGLAGESSTLATIVHLMHDGFDAHGQRDALGVEIIDEALCMLDSLEGD